ncbi:MAG: TauD/TfdA family dioxygenase [Pseudomonadota bacterium]|nr:TauD/TfdA family dioxygenase [Pseudomonadota bacterium]
MGKKSTTVLSEFFEQKVRSLKIKSSLGFFAGVVVGLSVSQLSKRSVISEIRSALDVFGVLIFREMRLSHSEQLLFAENLGSELHRKTGIATISKNRYGDEALTDVSNLDADGKILLPHDRKRLYGLSNRLWHTDASFRHPPGRYSILSAKVVPNEGGETEFSNTRDAYYMLPEKLRDKISGLQAHHSIAYSRQILGFEFSNEEEGSLKGVKQPLIRINRKTRMKSLYLASHCSAVSGMSTPDGRILIQDLIEHATQDCLVYRHEWRPDDLVVWDNFATMHRGLAYDDQKKRRELVRVTTLEI